MTKLFALLCCGLLLGLPLSGCAPQPRPIRAEPAGPHDLQNDRAACEEFARRFGIIDMEPVMPGSDATEFPDGQRQVQLYESCMLKKGYRF